MGKLYQHSVLHRQIINIILFDFKVKECIDIVGVSGSSLEFKKPEITNLKEKEKVVLFSAK